MPETEAERAARLYYDNPLSASRAPDATCRFCGRMIHSAEEFRECLNELQKEDDDAVRDT